MFWKSIIKNIIKTSKIEQNTKMDNLPTLPEESVFELVLCLSSILSSSLLFPLSIVAIFSLKILLNFSIKLSSQKITLKLYFNRNKKSWNKLSKR